jgi:hypothetical protein
MLLRNEKIICGQSIVSEASISADVRSLFKRYVLEWNSGSFASSFSAFLTAWNDSHFALVHMVAPPISGRQAYYALIMSTMFKYACDKNDALPGTDNFAIVSMNLKMEFALYSLYVLRLTAPNHGQPLLPLPISLSLISNLKLAAIRLSGDFLHLFRLLIKGHHLTITSWMGCPCSNHIHMPNWRSCSPSSTPQSLRAVSCTHASAPDWTRRLSWQKGSSETKVASSPALVAADLANSARCFQSDERISHSVFFLNSTALKSWEFSISQIQHALPHKFSTESISDVSKYGLQEAIHAMKERSNLRLNKARMQAATSVSSKFRSDSTPK